MKEITARIICCITILLVVTASGCVAPPKGNTTSSQGGNFFNPGQTTPEITETQSYVSEVTPFTTETTTVSGYHTVVPTTLSAQNLYCRIYSTTNTYAYNKTAIAFNLRSPPMYINYTVKPSNVTYTKVIDSKLTGGGEQVLTIDTYSPVSWFEVTVRNKTSGEIYLQDGFGTGKGYTEYLNRTLKILKRDDMQIEFAGNNITATAMVWVKPESNIDDTSKFNLSADCGYFDPNPRDTVFVATATPAT